MKNMLKYYRKKAGLTIEELADKVEAPAEIIGALERGEEMAGPGTTDSLIKISQALNAQPYMVFPNKEMLDTFQADEAAQKMRIQMELEDLAINMRGMITTLNVVLDDLRDELDDIGERCPVYLAHAADQIEALTFLTGKLMADISSLEDLSEADFFIVKE